MRAPLSFIVGLTLFTGAFAAESDECFIPITYNNPSLTVDLGVGLWGWPIAYDGNGDTFPDLIVVSGSSPYRGTYYFENTGRKDPDTGADIFKPARRLSDGANDVTPSYTPEGLKVLTPGFEHPDFARTGLEQKVPLPVDPKSIHVSAGQQRGKQWSYVDFDGNGVLDLIVGVGDWTDYGWDNAYDKNGRWTNGPLHGFVYVLKNTGTNEDPVYAEPFRLQADGRDIDMYGIPSPVFADFRGTGKLDLICGEFVDGLTYFENIGTRENPKYANGRRLRYEGEPITMPLEMIVVTTFDWNRDGRPDLVVAQEDGRVAWMENTGRLIDITNNRGISLAKIPEFKSPVFFRQEADIVKFGVLSTPVSADWDGDGLEDILTGNAAGEFAFIKNLGGYPPKWDEPVLLEANGKPLRIMAGYNGSIQGPAESKWGYTNIGVGDWDGDGLLDLVANSIFGKIVWYKNIGTKTEPKLAEAQPVKVAWPDATPKPVWNWWDPAPGELVVQWRCTPYVMDVDGDGINDLVTVDHEGYLAFYRQVEQGGERVLLPGERIFKIKGPSTFDMRHAPSKMSPTTDGSIRLSDGYAGRSGRRTYTFVDWDGDGKLDLLVNSTNITFLRNISEKPGEWLFEDQGFVDPRHLGGHSTSPGIVDWNADGIPDLLVGAEDGFFYYLENPRSGKK
ncbi:VCBS repeat-containing protein [Ruficoccus amylovorans]|uniref:VCBS repeat-containing protein n=1 Tax=Ruficoccus amylovorans TaxID=1804625 RepID=A0A842HB27_9BACT|nr:VCBS repeat-containing protein [Ruficoccus amylovorans]